MKLVTPLIVLLLAAVLVSCSEQGPHENGEVLSKLYNAVEERTLPERQEIQDQWALSVLALGSVDYLEETDAYEVSFLADPYDSSTKEIWGVNMRTGEVWPVDAGALFSAVVFFCQDKNDPSLECRRYLEAMELLIESPVPTFTSTASEGITDFEQEYWKAVNSMLEQIYGLPPVSDTDQLSSAAFLVSEHWSEYPAQNIQDLNGQGIEPDLTAPFCYMFFWYIDANRAMLEVSTPLDFIVMEQKLVDNVHMLDIQTDLLIDNKVFDLDPITTYPTAEECRGGDPTVNP